MIAIQVEPLLEVDYQVIQRLSRRLTVTAGGRHFLTTCDVAIFILYLFVAHDPSVACLLHQ